MADEAAWITYKVHETTINRTQYRIEESSDFDERQVSVYRNNEYVGFANDPAHAKECIEEGRT